MQVSLTQINIKYGDPDNNYSRLAGMIDSAANQNSSIVLLPELWSCGYDWEHINDHALQNRHLVDQLCNHANELSISIGGSLFAKDTAGTYSNEFPSFNQGLLHKSRVIGKSICSGCYRNLIGCNLVIRLPKSHFPGGKLASQSVTT